MPWFSAKARKKESLGVGGGHEKMDLSTNLLLLGKLSTQLSISTQVPQHFCGYGCVDNWWYYWTWLWTIGDDLWTSLDATLFAYNDENNKLLCMHLDLVNLLHMNISFH
jgi:hypothetical protein